MFFSSAFYSYMWFLNTFFTVLVDLFLICLWWPRLEVFLKCSFFWAKNRGSLLLYNCSYKKKRVLEQLSIRSKITKELKKTEQIWVPQGHSKDIACNFTVNGIALQMWIIVVKISVPHTTKTRWGRVGENKTLAECNRLSMMSGPW